LIDPLSPSSGVENYEHLKMTYDIGRMKWDMSNRKYLLLIKQTISDPIKGTIPECATAKEYLKRVESQFTGSSKANASALMRRFFSTKYDGSSGIHDHIMKLGNMASKLKDHDIPLPDRLVVHTILESLPEEFSMFTINYNQVVPETWTLENLMAMCVQEEERLKSQRGNDSVHMVKNGPRRKQFKRKGAQQPPQHQQPKGPPQDNKGKAPVCAGGQRPV